MDNNYIVSADGAKIAYKVFGKGSPLVLVHGMGSTKEMWEERNWINVFKKEFTVITIDTRGHGASDKSYSPDFYSIHNIINDINGVVKECGFHNYNYFGHSYGGTIGLQLCKYGSNISKMVCGGSSFGNKFFKDIVPEWIQEYERLNKAKKSNTLNELDLTQEDIEWIRHNDIDVFLSQFYAWNKWVGIDSKDIKTKLAIYSGTKDNPQVLDTLKHYAEKGVMNNITIKIFEGLNHTELVSNVAVVSPWVKDFLLN
ncbi:alpha/beta hydrolase [Anaerocolumna sp. AGMB13025]|uniref:alpha/beta fold hydrolase n=1 Tax=Anaerocolumna sp. AGMB13025 TaxID=3039116 RepID=UPI00241E2DEF|nr:alpha/beta hydrolase [Anaerocolumna sp. AGMB13025]WFR59558.1 alpha/beta hydrolase [Anaerocolumna sp. AGMB13025]